MPTLNRPARALRSEHIVMMRAILKAGGRPKAVRGQGGSSRNLQTKQFRYSSTGTRVSYQDWAALGGKIVLQVLETRDLRVLGPGAVSGIAVCARCYTWE